jgi:IS5 family transposase
MRKVERMQMMFGQVDISNISFDLRSRDEIPKLLRGLQHIYCTPELKDEVFHILEEVIPPGVKQDTGRPGMELWKILVLGTLRLNCDWDYDKLQEIANNHKTLRHMLGHGLIDEDYYYPLQTLKDNVSLLTVEVLKKVNQVVVKAGHTLVRKKNEAGLEGRCDTFVVLTDVHFPTDITLLWDAIRKVIMLLAQLCARCDLTVWRQYGHHLRQVRKLLYQAMKAKRRRATSAQKRATVDAAIKAAHQAYIEMVEQMLLKVEKTLPLLYERQVSILSVQVIDHYRAAARQLIDQIRRRIMAGETIPHAEKIFSLFEEQTEWICKGKAGVPQELGKRVGIIEDRAGFILNHVVLDHETDEQIATAFVRETKGLYPELRSCSFDKGFWTPQNLKELEQLLDLVILPKKGRLSAADQVREESPAFRLGRRRHAAVESGISALDNHGLDRCRDHGFSGFCRYVSLAIVARNLQKLGHILQQKEFKRQQRKERYRQTYSENLYRSAA